MNTKRQVNNMPIVMTDYKMIYKDQVFNVLSISFTLDRPTENNKLKIKFIQATFINENGEVHIIEDEAWCFKFVRR
jgi:hypothetical protein